MVRRDSHAYGCNTVGALMTILIAYLLSVIGGFFFVGCCMTIIRKTVFGAVWELSFKPLDFYVGGIERAAATSLIIFVPTYLPAFIGTWVTLKFATHWKRIPPNDDGNVTQSSLIALIGSVLSFGFAIFVTVLVARPDAVEIWNGVVQIGTN